MAVFQELACGCLGEGIQYIESADAAHTSPIQPCMQGVNWQNETHQGGLRNVSQSGSWMDCQSGSGPAPPAGSCKLIQSCCHTGL